MKNVILTLLLGWAVCLSHAETPPLTDARGNAVPTGVSERIVSVGGDITEILFELGMSDRIIARDDTSTYPPEVEDLPSIGYLRALSAEGIIAMNPSVILLSEKAGPPPVLKQLEMMEIPLVFIPGGFDLEAVVRKINIIATVTGTQPQGTELIQHIQKQHKALTRSLEAISDKKQVLFLLNAQPGSLMASGTGTAADSVLRLAGTRNVMSDFQGYRQISTEAALSARPDVIVLPSHGVEMMGGLERFLSIPGMKGTTAAQRDQIHVIDSQFALTFGPRFLQAAAELASRVYPDYHIPSQLVLNEETDE